MVVIGVAGNIASGKSTVARVFEQLGALVIDADVMVHELLKTDPMQTNLVETFGSEILAPEGAIDRRALGRIVFENTDARQTLNRIVRPAIRTEIRRRIAEERAHGHQDVIVVDAALMVETGPTDLADVIILVTAPPAVRKKRIIHRNQLSEEEAEQRIAAQTPDTQQAQWADYLLENTGTQAALTRQAENLWNQIVKD